MNRRDFNRGLTGLAIAPAGLLACRADSAPLNERMRGDIAPVHDPCIIKAAGRYHVFSTGQVDDEQGIIPWRSSADLVDWRFEGPAFANIPAWAEEAVPGTRGLWAPDIAWFNDRYHLYYSCSTFGSNHSVIGLTTNRSLDPDSPEFGWEDQGLVVRSQRSDDYNAIDSNHLIDNDGRHWLVLGSFWSGIKMFPLDPATGKLPVGNVEKYSLAARPVPDKAPGAVEAPFLIEREGWYYLFVSYDYCCRGAASSYYIVVGRSRAPTGPYVGKDGRDMQDGYGTLLLRGSREFRGPGHNAFLQDTGADYLVYHAYDASQDGLPTLRMNRVDWSDDGWPELGDTD